MESLINIGIIITYIMIGFAALTAILFGVKKMLSNTKNAKKTQIKIKFESAKKWPTIIFC